MSFKLKSDEARENKKKHIFVKTICFAAVIISIVYCVASFITTSISKSENEKKLLQLEEQTQAVMDSNEAIRRYIDKSNNMDEYIENEARDKLDYAKPDERVYYIVPSAGDTSSAPSSAAE